MKSSLNCTCSFFLFHLLKNDGISTHIVLFEAGMTLSICSPHLLADYYQPPSDGSRGSYQPPEPTPEPTPAPAPAAAPSSKSGVSLGEMCPLLPLQKVFSLLANINAMSNICVWNVSYEEDLGAPLDEARWQLDWVVLFLPPAEALQGHLRLHRCRRRRGLLHGRRRDRGGGADRRRLDAWPRCPHWPAGHAARQLRGGHLSERGEKQRGREKREEVKKVLEGGRARNGKAQCHLILTPLSSDFTLVPLLSYDPRPWPTPPPLECCEWTFQFCFPFTVRDVESLAVLNVFFVLSFRLSFYIRGAYFKIVYWINIPASCSIKCGISLSLNTVLNQLWHRCKKLPVRPVSDDVGWSSANF